MLFWISVPCAWYRCMTRSDMRVQVHIYFCFGGICWCKELGVVILFIHGYYLDWEWRESGESNVERVYVGLC